MSQLHYAKHSDPFFITGWPYSLQYETRSLDSIPCFTTKRKGKQVKRLCDERQLLSMNSYPQFMGKVIF